MAYDLFDREKETRLKRRWLFEKKKGNEELFEKLFSCVMWEYEITLCHLNIHHIWLKFGLCEEFHVVGCFKWYLMIYNKDIKKSIQSNFIAELTLIWFFGLLSVVINKIFIELSPFTCKCTYINFYIKKKSRLYKNLSPK